MGRMQVFLDLVKASRLLAPNLREMTMTLYTGQAHKGNQVAREVVRDHLAALRWMNPNAVIYLREARGQGTPTISYSLWVHPGSEVLPPKVMEITSSLTPEEVVAKVLMAARDPDLEASGGVAPSEREALAAASAAPQKSQAAQKLA